MSREPDTSKLLHAGRLPSTLQRHHESARRLLSCRLRGRVLLPTRAAVLGRRRHVCTRYRVRDQSVRSYIVSRWLHMRSREGTVRS